MTILAVDIVGSTAHIADCDPDDAQIFFDRCFKHMQRMIKRAGGTMVSFEGDGGIAAFGWPDAVEDHADSACRAAWGIQHEGEAAIGPDGRQARFRIGIHSGLVALRQLRRGGRMQLNTVGAAVHIAAKLEQGASAGSILVSADAARLSRFGLALGRRMAIPLPGGGSVEAFTLNGPPQSGRADAMAERYGSPMIGRQAQLAKLRRLLPRRGGQSHSAALVGEAGIGKSRLAAAALSEMIARDARTLVYFGDAQTRTTPFAAARWLLTEAAAGRSGAGPEELAPALRGAGFEEREIAALDASPGGTRHRQGKADRLTETQLARLFATAFLALALDRPTLLLIEDLHVVDPESRHFLRLLAGMEADHPLCLLATGRPESLEQAREIADQLLILEPLSRNAMKALGKTLWPEGRKPGAMLDRLVERADGIPFVLEELVRSLDAKGGAAILPQSVESLIHARLQRLSPCAKSLAQALSLLGENVDLAFAGAVVGREEGALLADLEELERFAFVHPRRGGFTHMRHQIIAEACADTIPRDRRRQLHRSAIGAIRTRHSSLSGRHEQLAFHAEGADDLEQALIWLWEAALEARRNAAITSLNLIFDRAIGLIEKIGEAAEPKYVEFVLMAFASMLQVGEFAKMNAHLPRIIALTRATGRPELICNSLSQLGMLCWFEGRYEEGRRASEEGLDIARQLNAPALIFSNQFVLANNLHCLGRIDDAIALLKSLFEFLGGELETARLGAPGAPRATIMSFISWFMMDLGAYEAGLTYAERGLEIAMEQRDPYSEVMARNALAHNLLLLGRNCEALELLLTAREMSERNGYDAIKANIAGRLAIALSRTGRTAEAVEIVEDCLRRKLHERTGQVEQYHLHAGHAEALFANRDRKRGLAALDRALAIGRQADNPCLIAAGLALRGRLLGDDSGKNRSPAAVCADELSSRVAEPRGPDPLPSP